MPLDNFSLVATPHPKATLYRGAQPDLDGFKTLHVLGVGGIFKLNTDEEFPDGLEESTADEVGIGFVSTVPMDPFSPRVEEVVGVVREAQMALEAGTSVFIHCTHGRDRTGLIIGAYRLLVNGWTFDQMMEERTIFKTNFITEFADHGIIEVLRSLTGKSLKDFA